MKDWRIVWALAVSMLAPVPAACIRDADLIIHHAKIYTSDKSNLRASALAVKDRLIMKIGTDRVVLALKGPKTRVIDARGKVLVPGLVDNHAHPLFVGAFQKATVDIFELKTKQDVIQNLAAFLQEHPEMPYLIGFSWHYQSPITVSDLDAVSREIPIVIWAYDAEGGSANSLALQLLLEDPGEYRKLGGQYNEQGRPTGQFIYFHQFNPFKSFKPWFVAQRRWEKVMELALAGMDEMLTEALRNGVTTVNDVQIYPELMPLILEFKARGGFEKIRVRGSWNVSESCLDDEQAFIDGLEAWIKAGQEHSDEHLILGNAVKMYMDGGAGTYTAWLSESYADRPGYTSGPLWDVQKFKRVMEIFDRYDLQVQTHACGDAAVHAVIDGYAHVHRPQGPNLRHRIEHAEFFMPGDMQRMAALEIYAAMMPTHFFGDETVKRTLGKKRIPEMMPWKTMAKAGIHVSFGSDRCISNPWSPFAGILVANRRIFYDLLTNPGKHNAISVEDALYYYTYGSAEALCMEDMVGSLAVGKRADMVILTVDGLDDLVSMWTIMRTFFDYDYGVNFVEKTFVDGVAVFERE